MTTMPRNLVPARATLAAAALLLGLPGLRAEAQATSCPPPRPVVSGPAVVNRYEGYSISWTNVLEERGAPPADIFTVERSEDPTFFTGVDAFQTTRTSSTYGPPMGVPRTLYHRVVVLSYCGGGTGVRVDSTTFAVQVTDQCASPIELPAPVVSPTSPPAYTTYVVSWDTLGAGQPGPGGGADGLRFRLRRTSANDVKETLNATGNAAFADGPGEYLYQVRTENVCGDASPWSKAARVVVGETKVAALVLVSAPDPVFVFAGAVPATTAFTVRNAGSEPLDVAARSSLEAFAVAPASFRLEPGQSRAVTATVARPPSPDAPLHGEVTLAADGLTLSVPVDASLAEEVGGAGPSGDGSFAAAGWDENAVDIDRAGNGVHRTLVNPGSERLAIVTSISVPWLSVRSLDGTAWDRPLAPGESRRVFVSVDRSRRRAAIGTEVGTVRVRSAGRQTVASLSVTDDGPLVTTSGGSGGPDLPPLYLMKSRLLFPSLPNARDALGIGRYTSDVWLSNVDALAPIQVVLTLTPTGQGNTSAALRQFVFSLGAGETRRFRNVVGTVFGYEGACSLDISSPAATLSATAMVNNKPLLPFVAGKTAALGTAIEGTVLSNAEFGFEMRPVAPGEGANGFDPTFVVSGLWHDARRRTNLILRETTGNQTVVRLQLFDQSGEAVLKDGRPVDLEVSVPPLGSLQLNDSELFPTAPISGSLWVRVEFRQGVVDPFGRNRGAVVPFATVIDSGTQDASLRVGVSTTALAPTALSSSGSLRALASSLPYDGGPESLFFPVARVSGAALSSGRTPAWRTRVTFTNVNDKREQRTLLLSFHDRSGGGATIGPFPVGLSAGASVSYDDLLQDFFRVPTGRQVWGTVEVANEGENGDGTWQFTWADVDVQTETYTADTDDPTVGEFRTGMEGYSYRHGYSSFQSNLGTVLIDGAETSPRNRTNLILQEVGGAPCTLTVAVYKPGALVPLAMRNVSLKAFDYVSRELFRDLLELDLEEVVDARVVVRQVDGDGVFMAFVSKINLVTGDPANVFLRPASAGTGR